MKKAPVERPCGPNDLIANLETMADTLELAGENPFKVRAFRKASQSLSDPKLSATLLERVEDGSIVEVPGVGKGILAFLQESLQGKTPAELTAVRKKIPPGLLELVKVPGLGPKKARVVVEELGVTSLGELEYACRENRLLKLEGFGEKLQAKVLSAVQFLLRSAGKMLLPDALRLAENIEQGLPAKIRESFYRTGELTRLDEVMAHLEWVFSTGKPAPEVQAPIRIDFHSVKPSRLGVEAVRRSSGSGFWSAIEKQAEKQGVRLEKIEAPTEVLFFSQLRLPFVAPEFRNDDRVFSRIKAGTLDRMVEEKNIRGVFHAHTTRSDGHDSLEVMIEEAQRLGLEYFGVSDHSQSAFYAHGLSVEDLKAQRRECETVQEKFPDCRVFWGIESDILKDGSLDYPEKVLSQFDFVIASVHSRFGLGKKEMTDRLVKALKHPQTRMLGHLTGRLLLGREGYELDVEEVIKVASAEGKAIEINAHPQRLDIDWRWGESLEKHKTWVSINPDAHEKSGISDFRFGVWMARKALIPRERVLNTLGPKEVASWLKNP